MKSSVLSEEAKLDCVVNLRGGQGGRRLGKKKQKSQQISINVNSAGLGMSLKRIACLVLMEAKRIVIWSQQELLPVSTKMTSINFWGVYWKM